MKQFYFAFLVFLLISAASLKAQLSILFVDDNGNTFGNAVRFSGALETAGATVTYFNVADSSAGPSSDQMAAFNLVVWHTSSIDNNLQFWNGTEEDNPEIRAYLDAGGKLWVVGLDYLFDRYGAPGPTSFARGDFPYDYLGVSSYDFQSFGNDVGTGVPSAFPDTAAVISGLNSLTWIFPALNWVDAVQLRSEASAIYRMGGEGYVFNGEICGAYYSDDFFTTLSYFFDLALVADDDQLQASIRPVLDHFSALISSTSDRGTRTPAFSVFPNPASGQINIDLQLEKNAVVEATLLDFQGRRVAGLLNRQTLAAGAGPLRCLPLEKDIPAGIYLVRVMVDGVSSVKAISLQE